MMYITLLAVLTGTLIYAVCWFQRGVRFHGRLNPPLSLSGCLTLEDVQ